MTASVFAIGMLCQIRDRDNYGEATPNKLVLMTIDRTKLVPR
jgi:hypothetical protein